MPLRNQARREDGQAQITTDQMASCLVIDSCGASVKQHFSIQNVMYALKRLHEALAALSKHPVSIGRLQSQTSHALSDTRSSSSSPLTSRGGWTRTRSKSLFLGLALDETVVFGLPSRSIHFAPLEPAAALSNTVH